MNTRNPIHLFLALFCLLFAVFLLGITGSGCAFKASTTTITTAAVYHVTPGTNGLMVTNLVSPATVTTRVRQERLWLPEGYAVTHATVLYGLDVAATDPSTTTPRIRLGFGEDSWRWIPVATNPMYAAPMTASGTVRQTGVPFAVSGSQAFTAGDTRVTQDPTNQVQSATAIVPGVPADQQK